MKNFIVKVTFIAAIFTLFLISLFVINRYCADFGIAKNKTVLIIGNSHPECAFNDALIPGVANLSESGEAYFYTYFKLKQLLEQNPQIDKVLIEFANEHIRKGIDKWIWDDMYVSYRFPKYASFMDADAIKLLLKHNPESVMESIPFLSRMNANMLLHYQLNYATTVGGYLNLDKCKVDSLLAAQAADANKEKVNAGDSLAVETLVYLDKIVECCKQKGVKMFFIRSPVHVEYVGYRNEAKFQKLRTTRYPDIEFLDFSKFPLANSEFADLVHLNKQGAKKFSLWFAQMVENGLLNKPDKQHIINKEMHTSFLSFN
ncbi:hypothetical protein [Bacteroides sp. 519]|uniref:hypothetical protein n=1 Tax=Bacteroides sp. 519 TaxID=2302937 RepID=UPI0013D1A585|nr:hypothetical protein [Bacteroides sp. 519]NDV60235.1 hypothetical protein [Bacteroides sp. 519]